MTHTLKIYWSIPTPSAARTPSCRSIYAAAPTLPHMGWNTLEAPPDSLLFEGIAEERFYFVHSYAASEWSLDVTAPFPQPKLTWAEHGTRFLAAVENGPLSATQFHPEKSGEPGIRLLSNWLESL